ncbi:MAG: phytoene desaturase [Planctomycetota bacterium]|nr:phytoene desaturase [Planctomycetota bacterium]
MQNSQTKILHSEREQVLSATLASKPSNAHVHRNGTKRVNGSGPGRLGTRGRAAVIGSGFGGLAAAIRLQSMGFETVCFEGRDQPGGRAYVYRDEGFTFDAGPTVITAPHCIKELFELSGRSMEDYVQLMPVDPMYRLRWMDGSSFDYVSDEARLIEQIRGFEPADVEGYRRFAEYSKRVFHKGYEELGAVPFLNFRDMLRVAPDLMKLRADRSVHGAVSRFLKNEHLRQAFSFHPLLVGGNPYSTSAIYTLIHWIERQWGVFFPQGGTGALVHGLVALFEELGGELRLNSPVDQIEVESSRNSTKHWVSSEGQARERFDLVVSNSDIHHTYSHLYRSHAASGKASRRLERMEWSMSLFVMYFGTNRRFDQLAHHTILFGNRYEGLLRDIFRGHTLPSDFSLYLHAPTVTDPSLAPAGCEAFYVLSPVPHLGRANIDWNSVAQSYGDSILASLENHLPGLQDSIVTRRHFTPANFQRELHAYQGSAFSVAPTLTQSAYFRPHNKSDSIPGLYIVGSGTHPGAGVPGVINTAKATCGLVALDFGVAVK